MTTRNVLRLASLLALGVCGCSAGAADDGAAADAVDTRDDARDIEATPEPPARRAQLARLVAAHLDPQTAAGDAQAQSDVDADRDGDGIADALEEALLRRYRPFYRFSKDGDKEEGNRPADPVTELAHASLQQMEGEGGGASGPLGGCGNADGRLDPPASLFSCRPDASFATAQAKKDYCLEIDPSRYGGVTFDEAEEDATGLFGHVVQDTIHGHPAYKIEYWQYFAFNNQDLTVFGLGSFGDHEGDWTTVHLWFDRTEHRVVRLVYAVHGQDISFDIPKTKTAAPTCRNCTVDVAGASSDANVGNFFDATERAKYDDNHAQFFFDALGYRHVVVYIERGGHEFWPGPWGHADPISWGPVQVHLDGHNGAGRAYEVPDTMKRPFNMGEVERPLTADARIVLSYDGYWGCTNTKDLFGAAPLRRSPPGPAMHCDWKWPNRAMVDGCE